MNKFKITLGDPSNDGHGVSEDYYIECNKTTKEIENAYKQACEKTGLSFTDNNFNNYTWNHPEYNDRQICNDYEDTYPSELAIKIFKEYNIEIPDEDNFYSEELLELFMNFIKIIIPDLDYKIVKQEIDELNITIGYGLFDN